MFAFTAGAAAASLREYLRQQISSDVTGLDLAKLVSSVEDLETLEDDRDHTVALDGRLGSKITYTIRRLDPPPFWVL
jgi:hypothetical protein